MLTAVMSRITINCASSNAGSSQRLDELAGPACEPCSFRSRGVLWCFLIVCAVIFGFLSEAVGGVGSRSHLGGGAGMRLVRGQCVASHTLELHRIRRQKSEEPVPRVRTRRETVSTRAEQSELDGASTI